MEQLIDKIEIEEITEEETFDKANWWEDKDFLLELQRRDEACMNGTAQKFTLAESIARAMASLQKQ